MSTLDISLLRKDENYYGAEGKKYLSNSDIRSLLKDPRSFRQDQPKTTALVEGSYLHTAILEPEKLQNFIIVDASTRTTKLYKEAIESSGEEILLLKSEQEELDKLVDAIKNNFDWYSMIYAEGALYEEPGIGQIKSTLWKGKADVLTSNYIIDVKTTSNIDDFRWSARKYNYDSQAWIYNQIFGVPLYFLAIEKKTCRMGFFDCSDEFLDSGREKVYAAIKVYERFFGDNPTESIDQYYNKETL